MSSAQTDSPLPPALDEALSERVESGQLDLPVLPTTASRVLGLSQDSGCDIGEVAALIERDQSLAAHVLHIANSAAFSPTQKIVSLQQAITRLGLSTLCEVTVAIVLKGSAFEVPGFEPALKELWRHSAATGVFAKEIARTLRRNVEGAFLCGLLHDIGKPVTLSLLPSVCKEVKVKLTDEIALAAMDQHHSLMGAMLVKEWELAPWVETVARHHHDYENATEHQTEVMVTCLADNLTHWAMESKEISEEALFELPVVADLDLYEDDLQSLLDGRDRAVDTAKAFA